MRSLSSASWLLSNAKTFTPPAASAWGAALWNLVVQRRKSSLEPARTPSVPAENGAQPHAAAEADKAADSVTPETQADISQLASVLDHPLLVVTREIEWGNLLIGFEQANKYAIRLADGRIVGFIAEESSLGRAILRQALRTHRAFQATVMDAMGTPVLRVHRPAYLISSSISVYRLFGDTVGPLLGEVHMNWHLWRRRYDLFDAQGRQFGEIDAPLLSVQFPIRGEGAGSTEGPGVLASIDKDWTGLGRELFTDARQYVIRMDPAVTPQGVIADAQRKLGLPEGAPLASASGPVEPAQAAVPSRLETPAEALQRERERHRQSLEHDGHAGRLYAPYASTSIASDCSLSELDMAKRAVILAAAISIDFDYFSLHSGSPGMFHMPFFFPIPIPGFGGAAKAENDAPPADTSSSSATSTGTSGAEAAAASGSTETPPWMQRGAQDGSGGGAASTGPNPDKAADPWATFEPGVEDPSQGNSFDTDIDAGYDEGAWDTSPDADTSGGFIESLWGALSGDDDDDED